MVPVSEDELAVPSFGPWERFPETITGAGGFTPVSVVM
jgi:hypothetical protein